MAVQIIDPMVLPAIGETLPGRDVKASTWQDMGDALNRVWARRGWRVQGPVFEEPWETTSTTYVTVNSATIGNNDLDDWQGLIRLSRKIYDAIDTEDAYQMRFDVYAQNLDVRASLTRLDTEDGLSSSSTTGQTMTTTHATNGGADSEWDWDFLTRDLNEGSRGGSGSSASDLAYWVIHVEAKVPVSGTGRLWTWGVRESPITAGANLPRGL